MTYLHVIALGLGVFEVEGCVKVMNKTSYLL